MTEDRAHALRKANLTRYLGFDGATHDAMVRALSRLPDDALEFAVSKCVFFSTGGDLNGQCLPARFIGGAEWVIVLNDAAKELETIVAHEVAHAYLGHSLDATLGHEETERQAREQTRAWGFSGQGADW